MTISRSELIAAGANFILLNSEFRRDASPVVSQWLAVTYPSLQRIRIYTDFSAFIDNQCEQFSCSSFEETRLKAAEFIRSSSNHTEADALSVPWQSDEKTAWVTPEWAAAHKINLDALLYAAAEKDDRAAVKMYLDAGANPLAQTFQRDCAARLGVAKGMVEIFDRPEWLDAFTDFSGETGLHNLARKGEVELIKQAYRSGANPNLLNKNGMTVTDVIDEVHRNEIKRVVTEVCANDILANTMEAGSLGMHSNLTARRI